MWLDILMNRGREVCLQSVNDAYVQITQHDLAPRRLAFETTGRQVPAVEIQALFDDTARSMIDLLGFDFPYESIRDDLRKRMIDRFALFPESKVVLEALRQRGLRMAVVSNGVNQAERLEVLGIRDYFDIVCGSWHIGYKKPDVGMFKLALEGVEASADEALVVGDTWESDIVGAEAAGIPWLHLVRHGDTRRAPGTITDLRQVVDFIDGRVGTVRNEK